MAFKLVFNNGSIYNLLIFDVVYLEALCVAEMTIYLAIFIRHCNAHLLSEWSLDERYEIVKFWYIQSLCVSLIDVCCKVWVDWKATYNRDVVRCCNFINVALSEDIVVVATVWALEVAHVLDDSEYWNVHEISHSDSLLDDEADKLLRACYDNDAIDWKALVDS